MIRLAKGGNTALTASELVVSVDVAATADLSALLVTPAGKVRTDADLVFFNAPDGPGVHVVAPADGRPWRVRVDLAQVPADVHAVRVVSSLDAEEVARGRTFGRLPVPVAHVVDGAGAPVAELELTGLDREVIVVVAELYRRDGGWKLRAVGQGYAGGLADLVRDHGVSVDDAPPAAPAAPAAPASPASPASPATPAASTGEVSLTKGRPVSLTKGQRVVLTKDGGRPLTRVRMGLGWDAIAPSRVLGRREAHIDLDASAVLYAGRRVADVAFYNNLVTRDGSVRHLGDNRTGVGEGDDETIEIDLPAVPDQVDAIVLIVTSYAGHTFAQVDNAFCRLVDAADGELARFTLAGGMPHTGLVMAVLTRSGATWRFQAVGDGITARTPTDAIGQLDRYL